MIEATSGELLDYLADVIERAERFGATVLPPNDAETVAWEREAANLAMEIAVRPPVDRRSRRVEIILRERWRSAGRDRWELDEYAYELQDQELGYRRALHRHHVEEFVRAHGVATHEHCEVTIGSPACDHYAPDSACRGAIDGLDRLYGTWLSGTKPDCSRLRCLE